MTTGRPSRWSARIAGLIFGTVFVLAGLAKLRDPQLFAMQLRGFRILPDPYPAWVALGLPWIELLGGLSVIAGPLRRGALLLLNACLLVFLAAMVSAVVRGLDIECGCFGSAVKTGLGAELAIDLALMALGLWLLRAANRRMALDRAVS